MYPDLHLVAYRQQEHELVQRLERRRIAQERGVADRGGVTAAPARTASLRFGAFVTGAAVGATVSRVVARLTGSRRAARGTTASTVCCSPA